MAIPVGHHILLSKSLPQKHGVWLYYILPTRGYYSNHTDDARLRLRIRVGANTRPPLLYDSRDSLVFDRPMFRPGTLPGMRGYVANVSSLGVRVEHGHSSLARAALQQPSSKICESNKNVAGKRIFALKGLGWIWYQCPTG